MSSSSTASSFEPGKKSDSIKKKFDLRTELAKLYQQDLDFVDKAKKTLRDVSESEARAEDYYYRQPSKIVVSKKHRKFIKNEEATEVNYRKNFLKYK